jgi:hypothetical protein
MAATMATRVHFRLSYSSGTRRLAMNLIIYVFSASFVLMSLALLFTYQRTRHAGLFLMGLTYGASAALAIVLMHWWPKVAEENRDSGSGPQV